MASIKQNSEKASEDNRTPFQKIKAKIRTAFLYFCSLCIFCIAIGIGMSGLLLVAIALSLWGILLLPFITAKLPVMTDRQRSLAFIATFVLASTGDFYIQKYKDGKAQDRRSQQVETQNKIKLAEFAPIREETIAKIKAFMNEKDYQAALDAAKPYKGIGDTTIDHLYAQANITIAAKAAYNPADRWRKHTEFSKIDDSQTIIIEVKAEDSFYNDFGRQVWPHLSIRCQENKTELFINYSTYLGLDSMPVTYRLDDAKAITHDWRISTNSEAVFKNTPIPLLRHMMNSKNLVIRLTPHGQNPVTTTFWLEGLSAAVRPVQEACGWK